MKPALIFILALFTVILSSCTTAYIPPELNTPAFHEQNEFRGGLSYGNSGTNLQLGYSFHKNIGITADVAYLRTFGSEPRLQRNWGMGLGFFTPLHKDKSVYFEIFSGFHISETRSAYNDDGFEPVISSSYENSQYHSIYVQPDISFPFKSVDLIFAVRVSYFNFTKYETHKLKNPELPQALGIEPAATIRLGSENLKFKTQIGTSFMGLMRGHDFNYTYLFIHFGFNVSF
jgi:hypothetical protein